MTSSLRMLPPSHQPVSRHLGLLALLFAAAGAGAVHAGNLSFLSDSPVSHFRQADVDLMKQNAREVLDSSDPAAQRSWSNPNTAASGAAQTVGQFTASGGTPCKRLRVTNQFRNLASDATYTVCKYPGRGWVINADAQPAGG
jgi:hypothetical protein